MFEGLETGEFPEVEPLLGPLLHCVCLLWASCPPYRKGDRIVTLFREISDHLIVLVRRTLIRCLKIIYLFIFFI